MKNAITISLILFCTISIYAQDNSIPSSVLKRTHQIEDITLKTELDNSSEIVAMSMGNVLLNNYVIT